MSDESRALRLCADWLNSDICRADPRTKAMGVAALRREIARLEPQLIFIPFDAGRWLVGRTNGEDIKLIDTSGKRQWQLETGARVLAHLFTPHGPRYLDGTAVPSVHAASVNSLRNAVTRFAKHLEGVGLLELASEVRRMAVTKECVELRPSGRVAVVGVSSVCAPMQHAPLP